jgi:hypothetical protein
LLQADLSFGKWYWDTAHFTGIAPADGTGAVPKAREVFNTLGFKMCDFSTSVSKTGSGDVLDKTGQKECYEEEVDFT